MRHKAALCASATILGSRTGCPPGSTNTTARLVRMAAFSAGTWAARCCVGRTRIIPAFQAPGRGHWEQHDARPCPSCAPVELQVSELLRDAFTFRCVRIDDMDERNEFERWLIATLAACPDCGPSPSWLGHYAYPQPVRSSGLWNVQHVGERTGTDGQLGRFEHLANAVSQ